MYAFDVVDTTDVVELDYIYVNINLNIDLR